MPIYLLIFLVIQTFAFAKVATITIPGKDQKLAILEMPYEDLLGFAVAQHDERKYCGGFVASFEGKTFDGPMDTKPSGLLSYSIERNDLVNEFMKQVSEPRLLANIVWFSSYPTRYYTTPSGVKAMNDLAAKWTDLTKNLTFAKVELYTHQNWAQPSVILTLKGKSDEVIVVGGHGDSINTALNEPLSPAPGSDDNASGISVITEVIKILADNSYQPNHTIQFMAYAAEEVGLLGSMEITQKYLDEDKQILGVIQFDGTNFKGSKDLGMVLMSDLTNTEQNKFVGNLIDTYLQIPWGYDQCGYACTDSFSWTYRGFVASFAAEARIKEENPTIHSGNDTLKVSKNSASHAVNFAKLGLAYVVELDK